MHPPPIAAQPPGTTAPTPTSGCTCSKLRRLTRRITAVYDRELAAAGLRVTQYSLLATLLREAQTGLPVGELAPRLDMDRTTLTRNLKPLVQQGWAELAGAEHDARVRLARITPEGRAKLQAARPHWLRAQSEVQRTLGDDTVAGLHRWLDAVTPAFRPADGEAA